MAQDSNELTRIKHGAGEQLKGVEESPDPETQVEKQSVELEKARTDIASLRQNIEERKKYAERIFVLICCWVAAPFLLLLAHGFGQRLGFWLPQSVMLAAIGSTTVNVLGLFYIVAHYLFPDGGHRMKL